MDTKMKERGKGRRVYIRRGRGGGEKEGMGYYK